jgi:hypothetical protein
MTYRTPAFLLTALFFCQIAGHAVAQRGGTLDPSSGSSVEIDRVQPSIATALQPGARVTFSVEFDYTMSAPSGYVTLFIQSNVGPIGHEAKRLPKGSGKLTLSKEVEIPKTRRIEVIVALYHDDGRSTSVTDSRTYEVKRE